MQNLRRGLAKLREHNPSIALVIQEEKDVVSSLTKLIKERTEAGQYLTKWGASEHADLMDITIHSNTVGCEIQNSFNILIAHYNQYREGLKEIKKLEDGVHDCMAKHKAAHDKLQKAVSSQKPLEMAQKEEAQQANEAAVRIAECESVKRAILKAALLSQSTGWEALGKTCLTVSTFQNHLANQIPQGKLAPGQELPAYTGAETTKMIIQDFKAAISSSGSQRDLSVTVERSNSLIPMDSLSLSSLQRKPSNASMSYAQTQDSAVRREASIGSDPAAFQQKDLHRDSASSISRGYSNASQQLANQPGAYPSSESSSQAAAIPPERRSFRIDSDPNWNAQKEPLPNQFASQQNAGIPYATQAYPQNPNQYPQHSANQFSQHPSYPQQLHTPPNGYQQQNSSYPSIQYNPPLAQYAQRTSFAQPAPNGQPQYVQGPRSGAPSPQGYQNTSLPGGPHSHQYQQGSQPPYPRNP